MKSTEPHIDGVTIKELVTHADDRGFFRELVRATDGFFAEGFAQLNHAVAHTGIAKAWHLHARQTEWVYVATGLLKFALHDTREASPTFRVTRELLLGEQFPRVVRIPPGVAHGLRVIGGPVHMFYLASRTYDPSDELRIPHDDPTIGYDWTRGPSIK